MIEIILVMLLIRPFFFNFYTRWKKINRHW